VRGNMNKGCKVQKLFLFELREPTSASPTGRKIKVCTSSGCMSRPHPTITNRNPSSCTRVERAPTPGEGSSSQKGRSPANQPVCSHEATRSATNRLGWRTGVLAGPGGGSAANAELSRARTPHPCNEAYFLHPPKSRTPAAQALAERDRTHHLPGGALGQGPWRVRGGERGQTWACAAPGSQPTATASAGAPALGHSGGSGPPRALLRTGSGARIGAVPVREGPSRDTADYRRQLPSPCSPDRPRELAALWARERVPMARGSAANVRRGGVEVLGAVGTGYLNPVTGFGFRDGRCTSPRFGDFRGTSEAKLTDNRGSKPVGSDSLTPKPYHQP